MDSPSPAGGSGGGYHIGMLYVRRNERVTYLAEMLSRLYTFIEEMEATQETLTALDLYFAQLQEVYQFSSNYYYFAPARYHSGANSSNMSFDDVADRLASHVYALFVTESKPSRLGASLRRDNNSNANSSSQEGGEWGTDLPSQHVFFVMGEEKKKGRALLSDRRGTARGGGGGGSRMNLDGVVCRYERLLLKEREEDILNGLLGSGGDGELDAAAAANRRKRAIPLVFLLEHYEFLLQENDSSGKPLPYCYPKCLHCLAQFIIVLLWLNTELAMNIFALSDFFVRLAPLDFPEETQGSKALEKLCQWAHRGSEEVVSVYLKHVSLRFMKLSTLFAALSYHVNKKSSSFSSGTTGLNPSHLSPLFVLSGRDANRSVHVETNGGGKRDFFANLSVYCGDLSLQLLSKNFSLMWPSLSIYTNRISAKVNPLHYSFSNVLSGIRTELCYVFTVMFLHTNGAVKAATSLCALMKRIHAYEEEVFRIYEPKRSEGGEGEDAAAATAGEAEGAGGDDDESQAERMAKSFKEMYDILDKWKHNSSARVIPTGGSEDAGLMYSDRDGWRVFADYYYYHKSKTHEHDDNNGRREFLLLCEYKHTCLLLLLFVEIAVDRELREEIQTLYYSHHQQQHRGEESSDDGFVKLKREAILPLYYKETRSRVGRLKNKLIPFLEINFKTKFIDDCILAPSSPFSGDFPVIHRAKKLLALYYILRAETQKFFIFFGIVSTRGSPDNHASDGVRNKNNYYYHTLPSMITVDVSGEDLAYSAIKGRENTVTGSSSSGSGGGGSRVGTIVDYFYAEAFRSADTCREMISVSVCEYDHQFCARGSGERDNDDILLLLPDSDCTVADTGPVGDNGFSKKQKTPWRLTVSGNSRLGVLRVEYQHLFTHCCASVFTNIVEDGISVSNSVDSTQQSSNGDDSVHCPPDLFQVPRDTRKPSKANPSGKTSNSERRASSNAVVGAKRRSSSVHYQNSDTAGGKRVSHGNTSNSPSPVRQQQQRQQRRSSTTLGNESAVSEEKMKKTAAMSGEKRELQLLTYSKYGISFWCRVQHAFFTNSRSKRSRFSTVGNSDGNDFVRLRAIADNGADAHQYGFSIEESMGSLVDSFFFVPTATSAGPNNGGGSAAVAVENASEAVHDLQTFFPLYTSPIGAVNREVLPAAAEDSSSGGGGGSSCIPFAVSPTLASKLNKPQPAKKKKSSTVK